MASCSGLPSRICASGGRHAWLSAQEPREIQAFRFVRVRRHTFAEIHEDSAIAPCTGSFFRRLSQSLEQQPVRRKAQGRRRRPRDAHDLQGLRVQSKGARASDRHLPRNPTMRKVLRHLQSYSLDTPECRVVAGFCLLFSQPILFVGATNLGFDSAFVRLDLKIERYIVLGTPLHAFVDGPPRIATDLLPSECFLVGRTC